jgi:hypothetical protein
VATSAITAGGGTANGVALLVDLSRWVEKTIATGVISVHDRFHTVDTESDDASDDLVTINGSGDCGIVTLRAADSSRTVVLKDATGNLHLAGDCTLDNARDTITLARNDSSAVWYEISRSNNDT